MSNFTPIVFEHDGDDAKVLSRMPADESVVEVKLHDGTIQRAWFGCNIMDAGDYDFVPVDGNDEPDLERDSIADKVVAWRAL